jgi:hypothetical protein
MTRRTLLACQAILFLCACSGEEEAPSMVELLTHDAQTTSSSGSTPVPTSSSPTPSAPPAPHPVAVAIAPLDAQVWVPALGGPPAPGYASTTRLKATVILSDNSTHSTVTWSSMAPTLATVDQEGRVTAIAPGTGIGPWPVEIRAIAPGGTPLGVAQILVRAEGDLEVEVE